MKGKTPCQQRMSNRCCSLRVYGRCLAVVPEHALVVPAANLQWAINGVGCMAD